MDTNLIAGQRATDRPRSHQTWEHFVDVRRILPTPGLTGYLSLSLLIALWRAIGAADVIHVQLARDLVPMSACLIAFVRRRPVVAQCHGMITRPKSNLRRVVDIVTSRHVLRRIRCFLVYNEAERANIAMVAGRDIPYRILLNGADLPMSWSDDHPSNTASPWRIVFAARLHPRKRVGMFIAMAQQLAEKLPETIDFLVYGADGGDMELVRHAAASGIVSYEGTLPLEELRAVLASADVLVLPSINEPFSITILDAQARGCPVVVSDSNGFAPHVTEWSSGAVFISDDLTSLTDAVQNIIGSQGNYSQMRRQARALTEQHFSWAAVAEELSACYVAAMVPR